MNLYVIRHGQTKLNAEQRLQGRKGEPLNNIGIEQAKKLGLIFKNENILFDYVYSSPQERAIQTAKISTGQDPIVDNRLEVFNLGTADRLLKSEVIMRGCIPNPDYYQNVESVIEYRNRIFSFLDELLTKYRNTNKNILIAGHKCTTGCISAYFQGFKIENEYDDFLTLSSPNGTYKRYSVIKEIDDDMLR